MAQLDDPQLAAFKRLLDDAHHGGQAKVDALVALAQRTIYVVPWPGGIEGWRTLVNREGVAALPIFSHASEVDEAARRYGWLDAHGEVPRQEVGARAAFSYAVRENLSYVVLDIASTHAVEFAREELAPLLTAAARRDSAGPYAGAGRVSSSLIRAVRPTPSPTRPSDGHMRPTPPPGSLIVPPPPIEPPSSSPGLVASPSFDPSANAATFGGGSSVTLTSLAAAPADELIDALATVLRGYPEVEWACLFQAARGPAQAAPAVGLRLDAGYRQRVNEIIGALRRAGEEHGAGFDVLLLDDAALMRTARGLGLAFYPWRK